MKDGHAIRNNILTPSIVTSFYELLSATMDCLPPDLREAAEVKMLCRYNYSS